jgi:hypothetical protein
MVFSHPIIIDHRQVHHHSSRKTIAECLTMATNSKDILSRAILSKATLLSKDTISKAIHLLNSMVIKDTDINNNLSMFNRVDKVVAPTAAEDCKLWL